MQIEIQNNRLAATTAESQSRKRAARTRTLAIVALASVLVLGSAIARISMPAAPGAPAPDFTLADGSGHSFRLSDLRGHPIALFFGYTHCPDVCPTTLAALARAKRKLGPAGAQFDVVFITVDPLRDSAAVVSRYVRQFDPSFTGLSGTPSQLAPVYAAYKVYHQALPARDSAGGYSVAHSSNVEFIDPEGRIRGSCDWSDTPDQIAVTMRAYAS
jgi:protein SCO1